VQRLLDRVHDPGLARVDVGREVVDEVVLGHPGEALGVDIEVSQGRAPRCLLQQPVGRRVFLDTAAV
jgi:hypothetical protein